MQSRNTVRSWALPTLQRPRREPFARRTQNRSAKIRSMGPTRLTPRSAKLPNFSRKMRLSDSAKRAALRCALATSTSLLGMSTNKEPIASLRAGEAEEQLGERTVDALVSEMMRPAFWLAALQI